MIAVLLSSIEGGHVIPGLIHKCYKAKAEGPLLCLFCLEYSCLSHLWIASITHQTRYRFRDLGKRDSPSAVHILERSCCANRRGAPSLGLFRPYHSFCGRRGRGLYRKCSPPRCRWACFHGFTGSNISLKACADLKRKWGLLGTLYLTPQKAMGSIRKLRTIGKLIIVFVWYIFCLTCWLWAGDCENGCPNSVLHR